MLGRISDKKDRPTLRNTIEDNLRKVYQEMLEEEVPDRFKQLLAELKKAQGTAAEIGPETAAGGGDSAVHGAADGGKGGK